VRGAVRGAVRGGLTGAVRGAVRGGLTGAVRGAVRGGLTGAVRGALMGAGGLRGAPGTWYEFAAAGVAKMKAHANIRIRYLMFDMLSRPTERRSFGKSLAE